MRSVIWILSTHAHLVVIKFRPFWLADRQQTSRKPSRRRMSPASLLVSGDLSDSTKKPSQLAQKVQVATQQGQGVVVRRTDIAEVWLPLQGAGSDARVLVRLQGKNPLMSCQQH